MVITGLNASNPILNTSSGLEGQKTEAQEVQKTDLKKTSQNASNSLKEKSRFFENFLNRSKAVEKPNAELINNRIAQIRHKAKLVKSHPMPDIIKDYLKEVKGFITDVKDHAFKHQMNDEKLFERMEIIDKKLVDIADKILEDNKTELGIISDLGDLEGLLIDFYI